MADEVRLLVGGEGGLVGLASRDGGRSWGAPEILIEGVDACAIHGAPDGTVYVGTRGNGMFRSAGKLDRWDQMDVPPDLQKARSLCITEARFLVGTEPSGVWEWADRRRWQPVGDFRSCPGVSEWFYPVAEEDDHIRHLSLDPHRPERIYAAIQVGGVGISPDSGDTWYDKRNLDCDVHMVVPHPGKPGVVYAGSGGEGLYRSADWGESWELVRGEGGNFVVQFALDPRDPDRVYVGTARGGIRDWRADPEHGARGEMFLSEDGGDSWRKLSGGLPPFLQARPDSVCIDPEAPDQAYFGGGGKRRQNAQDAGVYQSRDSGESWRRIADIAEPVALWCARV